MAHKIGAGRLDRLVEEAIARFMPETAEETRRRAADGRHFTIDHDQVSFAGTSLIHGELDLADALDLDEAIRGIADQLKDLGSTESLDVRRSVAAGELARRQLALDLQTGDPSEIEEVRGNRPKRAPAAGHLVPAPAPDAPSRAPAGWAGWRTPAARSPSSRSGTWCGHPDAQVVVKPVLDLADHVHVEAYEVPDRIVERPSRCATTPAPSPGAPGPPADSAPTSTAATATTSSPTAGQGRPARATSHPLCRRHHRLKTHGGWTYTTLEPGTYLWSSPHRYQYLRNHEGTQDVTTNVTADRRSPAPRPDE